MICINCPMGCVMQVEVNGAFIKVSGNTCPKGKIYAEKECTNPTRIVTTSIKVEGGQLDVVSAKTQRDIPKNKIFDVLLATKTIKVKAPIEVGEVLVYDIAGTGSNLVATKKISIK
ncbi:MAG: DUF1667 domain-containing protein [Cellulosilyticaceae bacterium]